MADIVIATDLPNPETGVQLKEKYKDMGDGTHARVVSAAGAGGGGASSEGAIHHLQASDGAGGFEDAGTPAAMLAALGVAVKWNSSDTYPVGIIAKDRGGDWLCAIENTNSQPVSGNTNWTLIGGNPYVDSILNAAALTSLPFYDVPQSGVGYTFVPAPGANLMLWPTEVITLAGIGDVWSSNANINFFLGDASAGNTLALLINPVVAQLSSGIDPSGSRRAFPLGASSDNDDTIYDVLINQRLTGFMNDDLSDPTPGTSSLLVRVYYTIRPTAF